jgi:hypothetical protein
MVNPEIILQQLLLDGHEGDALLAAFCRWWRALEGGIAPSGSVQARPAHVPDVANATHAATPNNAAKAANVGLLEPDTPPAAKAANIGPVAAPKPAKLPTKPEKAVVVTAPPENAKAIARKAIAQSMLAPSAIAVGSQLIEHFNLKTGRCDPGMGSIAASLGISLRSTRRAIASLVATGLFGRGRHRGRAHTNAYQPNWPLMVERAGEGDLISSRPILASKEANVGLQNHLRKPDTVQMLVEPQRRRATSPPDNRQGRLLLPMDGGRARKASAAGTAMYEAAREAVRAKLNRALSQHITEKFLPDDRPGFVAATTASMSADWESAMSAELARAGEGLPILLARIGGLNEAGQGGSTARKAVG